MATADEANNTEAMARRIPIHDRTGALVAYATVDPDDFDRFGSRRFHLHKGYAAHSCRVGGKPRTVFLHREIVGLSGTDQEIDHINRDKLDNRRSNLRVVTHAQNQQNMSVSSRNRSGYRGVSWSTTRGKWRAQAMVSGYSKHLGYFEEPETADRVVTDFRAAHMPYSEEELARP